MKEQHETSLEKDMKGWHFYKVVVKFFNPNILPFSEVLEKFTYVGQNKILYIA